MGDSWVSVQEVPYGLMGLGADSLVQENYLSVILFTGRDTGDPVQSGLFPLFLTESYMGSVRSRSISGFLRFLAD